MKHKMVSQQNTRGIQKTARLTGILYLLLVPLGIFGIIYTSTLTVSGDAAATASNIASSKSIYQLSILAALACGVVNTLVVLLLHKLLKPVNSFMASLMKVFLLISVPVGMMNELNRIAVLNLLSNEKYLEVFTSEQLQAHMMFFLKLHEFGIEIGSIYWGLWLFPMGYLVYKSGFLPKFIGLLLIIGCFGYLIDVLIFFFWNNAISLSEFTFIGEVILPLWLFFRGVNVEAWQKFEHKLSTNI